MFIRPIRIKTILTFINKTDPKILDIGSGSHSPVITKKWLPGCHYTGVDKDKKFNNDDADLKAMDEFIEMDLTKLQFDKIPDNNYDIIIMSHVIEHLYNGDSVVAGIVPKLKTGGIIYLEFPSERSIHFPSMRETLNFFDDPTHCRIYNLKEVCNILMQNNIKILKAGICRRFINILVIPVKVIYHLLTVGYVRAGVFWDLYGFAEYVAGKKI